MNNEPMGQITPKGVQDMAHAMTWKFIPNPDAKPEDVELGRLFWEIEILPDRVRFNHNTDEIAERYGVSVYRVRAIQAGAGMIEIPTRTCPCEKFNIHWKPSAFANRTEFERFFRGWRNAECDHCRDARARQQKEQREAYERIRQRQRYGSRVVGDCPRCDGLLVLRASNTSGTFIGCSNFPRCEYAAPLRPKESARIITEEEIAQARKALESAPKCPLCNCPLRAINGKFGPFFGCTNYPRCRYRAAFEQSAPPPAPKPEPKVEVTKPQAAPPPASPVNWEALHQRFDAWCAAGNDPAAFNPSEVQPQ